jgi:hypothetical protein
MSDRIALLYEQRDGFRFDSLARDMAVAGMSILRPVLGGVWLLDHEGESIVSDVATLAARVDAGREQSFQWWLAENDDVYCRIRPVGSLCVIELGMEGTTADERDHIGRALRSRFLSDPRRSVGWVLDPSGVAQDFAWDDFFVERRTGTWGPLGMAFPVAVGVRGVDCARMEGVPSSVVRSDHGELAILSADAHWLAA